jgi:ribosomal protein S18 acetylase RimI-like enzyme
VTIEVKVLGCGDDGVLSDVGEDVFDDPIDPDRAREFLEDPRHHMTVAVEDGLVVGFVSAVHYVHPDKRHPELWINEVGVASTHRGRGVGKAVLRAMLDVARELGCDVAWVLTDRSNTAARALYSTTGGAEAPGDTTMFEYFLTEET